MSRRRTGTENPSRTEWPKVGVVVLTWENYDEASDCLASLEGVSYPNMEVFVVDNGSEDGSVERLEREFEWCTFVKHDENVGVTRGNNAGIEAALDDGSEYVLLLNDDTIVTAGFLTPLVLTAERNPDTAVVGGVNYRASTGEIHNAGASFSTLLGGQTFLTDERKHDEPYPVDYVPTCLALLDAEFVADNEVLCEEYFLGMEDVDLARQAREAGRDVLVTPDSEIFHRLGATSSKSPFAVYHRTRNRYQFAKRHLEGHERRVFLGAFLLWRVTSCLQWLADSDREKLRAVVKGIADARTGERFRSYEELSEP
ncbi:glycosyltransferase family 2 protein [Haloarcula sp. S1CR25-12]|uniref:Glycosyltransferase family 2 protein n=1 Tax=Haloarcula saliterrae TaxID=2950534 RepID=A0ABU2FGG4_9EURY|nr:glycosyltransferase family 2 protein [Haloarcula sp. S1CR25-12]MDS0261341.1 glycosyltransferase family 2 protein [Haloarcula sp. S1CR25-12]